MTGVDPKPVGRKGLVTKARSFSPVVFLLVELGLEYFAHETRNNVPSRTKIGAAFSFKPATPKCMRNGELDAKRWIITEQKLWYSVWGRQIAIVLVTWTTKDTKLHKGCPLSFVFLRALRG